MSVKIIRTFNSKKQPIVKVTLPDDPSTTYEETPSAVLNIYDKIVNYDHIDQVSKDDLKKYLTKMEVNDSIFGHAEIASNDAREIYWLAKAFGHTNELARQRAVDYFRAQILDKTDREVQFSELVDDTYGEEGLSEVLSQISSEMTNGNSGYSGWIPNKKPLKTSVDHIATNSKLIEEVIDEIDDVIPANEREDTKKYLTALIISTNTEGNFAHPESLFPYWNEVINAYNELVYYFQIYPEIWNRIERNEPLTSKEELALAKIDEYDKMRPRKLRKDLLPHVPYVEGNTRAGTLRHKTDVNSTALFTFLGFTPKKVYDLTENLKLVAENLELEPTDLAESKLNESLEKTTVLDKIVNLVKVAKDKGLEIWNNTLSKLGNSLSDVVKNLLHNNSAIDIVKDLDSQVFNSYM